ncbi:unnamed protein product [Adineta ricciae]|uniref:UMOD/GP2/OIT3-like D8C domain-containing protein n=1 Tax=Adineta ricciae TaxID=249248 RepID=A0A815JWD7_ADIRI|nr:unnamed protein product [Adineta ricciae]CAF1438315.1 unnamed protein product [Adineta ricciae]
MAVRYPNAFQTPSRNVNANRNHTLSELSTYGAVKTTSAAKIIVVVVFTVVVVTLLAAAITVPLVLALTNTGPFATTKSSGTTTTAVTTTTVVTTASTTTNSFSECSSYTNISDATRLTTASGGSACDSSIFSSSTTWVRFTGSGGTQLATTAPSANQCGTQASGWYSSSLPSSGSSINGTACYVWGSNNCNWSNAVRVTNCGSFYVFGLVTPPVCNARYCTV